MILRLALAVSIAGLVILGVAYRGEGLPQVHCWHLAQERVSTAQWVEIQRLSSSCYSTAVASRRLVEKE